MITVEQRNEIDRLASLLATARVRRAVVGMSASGNPKETKDSTARNVRRATENFQKYLKSITEGM